MQKNVKDPADLTQVENCFSVEILQFFYVICYIPDIILDSSSATSTRDGQIILCVQVAC